MNMKLRLLFISFTAVATLVAFNNCGALKGRSSSAGVDGLGSQLGEESQIEAPGGNDEIVPLSDTRTAGIVRSNRTLDNLVSCLGTGTASQAAKDAWEEQKTALSAEGAANSITSTMFVAFESVASEICNDLIGQERSVAAAQRRIFNQVNFNSGPANVNDAAVADITRRLARSCWGRNESPEELAMIQQNSTNAFQAAGNNNAQTVNKLIFICTAVASSFATVGM